MELFMEFGNWNPFQKKSKEFNVDNILNKAVYSNFFIKGTPLLEPRPFKQDLLNGYMQNELVYSIVNKLAETASSVPLVLEDKNGKVVENHWVNELLKHPNEDNSMKDLINSYYIYLLAIGNSYIYAPKIDNGLRTTELHIMPSEEVYIIRGDWQNPIEGYKIRTGLQDYTAIPKSNILHGKLFNPRFEGGQWLYGLSPIEVSSEIISAYNQGVGALESSFRNMGPPYIISVDVPEGLTPEQQLNLEKKFKEKYSDSTKFNKPMLSGSKLTVQMIGFSPVDLNILENNREALRTLCNVYGVPSVLFNDQASSTYNNVEQARLDFYNYSIIPMNDSFSVKLTNFLGIEKGLKLRFNYENVEVLQNAIFTKSQSLKDMDYLTANEKREQLGYGPIKINKEDVI